MTMKISDLKPCALCGGPLLKPPIANWYVLRVSLAMLHPKHARETLALNSYFGGALGIAEVMSPAADKAVAIIAEQPGGTWSEVHVCFDCYTSKLTDLCGAIESADKAEDQDAALSSARGDAGEKEQS